MHFYAGGDLEAHAPRLGALPNKVVLDHFGGLDADQPAADTEVWEKVVRQLRAGLMPPAGAPRPDRATLDALRHTIEASIDRAASA